MATKEELEKKIDKFEVNMTRTDRIVNGTENEDVIVDGGQLVPSIRKWQKEMEEEYGVPAELVVRAETAAGEAEEDADRAETASGAAFINADVYPDVATGRAAVADGEQFQVVEGSEIVRYRRDSASTQTEVARYPAADAVFKPNWAGKTSGWPDPFFRNLDIGEDFPGNTSRWWYNSLQLNGWELSDNPIFNGRALQRKPGLGTSELSGPLVHLSDVGASVGDKLTVRLLVVGGGARVYAPGRQRSATGSPAPQINASPMNLISSPTPQLMTVEFTIVEGADRVVVYPYTDTAGQGFKVVALWAYKGAAGEGPAWPIYFDDQFLSVKIATATASISQITPAINYAVSITESVAWDSQSVELGVSSVVLGNAHSLPFRGWGGSRIPSGISFNAIRAPLIGRSETPPEGRWSRIHVIIKTGADANDGNVVAVGSVSVNPDDDVLQNVTILLTDPNSGDIVTLSDSDLGAQYFIGMYAENATGGPAGMGRMQADQPNGVGVNHYLTTQNPAAPWMPVGGAATNTVAFEHLLLVNPRIEESYTASDALKADVGGGGSPVISEPVSWAPPKVYVTHGIEGSIYLDGLIADEAADYAWAVSGVSQGMLQHERWTVTPNDTLSAPAFKMRIHEKRTGQMLTEHTLALVGASSNAGSGQTRRVQVIGDSFVAGGHITQTLLDDAAGDVMGIELIGTRGTGVNRHEGRGGWRIDDYATAGRTYYEFVVSGVAIEPQINSTRYTNNGATFTVQEAYLEGGNGRLVCSVTGGLPSASGTLTKAAGVGDSTITFSASSPVSGNPFWVGGQLDYEQYLTDNNLDVPHIVFIALGVNDAFGQSSDVGVVALAAERFGLLDELIASIKGAGVDSVALVPPSGPSSSQDSFAASYGNSYTQWRVKRNFVIWNQELVKRYAGEEGNGIHIVPAGLNWDTVNNISRAAAAPVNSRSTVMVERQSNGVHPAINGYQQIGDALWAFLKCTA